MTPVNTIIKRALWLLICLLASPVFAESDCKHRGDLDPIYCDENRDLVADAPRDAKRLKNPGTLLFSYTPVEDPSVYESIFKPFTDYLAQCLGRKVAYNPVQSNAAEIEAMRAGRLHVAGFATGPTGFAVNIAGAVPFAINGTEKEFQGYNLIVLVKKQSALHKLSDLQGKTVAHTSPSSNSGHVAPAALFPKEGLVPGKDYKIMFSGKHDESVMGVLSGNYDAAAVASDVFRRMIVRGQIAEDDFRIIYRSTRFPTSSFAYAHDLDPALRDKVLKCFFDYRFPGSMSRAFDGADRFYPISYQKDWGIIRSIAETGGEGFSRAVYEKESRRAHDARTKQP
jgi:phosphonate transport system substrate-binding protein